MAKVFIDGQAGTTGLQIHDRLKGHAAVQVLEIDEALRKDDHERGRLMNGSDVVFLCLPDAAAKEAVGLVANPKTIVIDASTAHRVSQGWTYGLPELSPGQKHKLAGAKRIANPGCYATGFILAVRPLVELGLVSPDYPFTCHGLSGFSGAGKGAIAEYESPSRPIAYDSPRQYGLTLSHKHLPEMKAYAGLAETPIFNPVICDFYQGMAVSVPVYSRLMARKRSAAELTDILQEHYAPHPLVKVLGAPEDGFLPANLMAKSDAFRLYVFGNDEKITLVSLFDNLGKGASGAAVQNMNIALGLPEYESLTGI